jgi:hypothetical protein
MLQVVGVTDVASRIKEDSGRFISLAPAAPSGRPARASRQNGISSLWAIAGAGVYDYPTRFRLKAVSNKNGKSRCPLPYGDHLPAQKKPGAGGVAPGFYND